MRKDIEKISDPELRNAVWNFQTAVDQRRDRKLRSLLRHDSNQQVARATQLRDAVRQGEKPEDA